MSTIPTFLLSRAMVTQPAHLEGDPTFATEILPGPPSLVSAQQTTHKQDTRKSAAVSAYLPVTDPGSTYSMHLSGTLGLQEPDGFRRKRARVEKNRTTSRSHRASARNHSSGPATTETPLNDIDGASSLPADSDLFLATDESSVKEEPKTILLHTPEPLPASITPYFSSGSRILASSANQLNEDHCSACHSQGALVYCDGCPRAFHFWCLDPPLDAVDLPEGDSSWFCPGCLIRKDPLPKPPPSLLSPLIQQVQSDIPSEYRLPEDIRSFFRDVATSPRGTYVDSTEIKQPRLNRHGQIEDRDPYRLKDRNNIPVLCFRCGFSALPSALAATTSEPRARRSSKIPASVAWRSIVSCDFCSLHWHLDCLDPPPANMPPFGKKWMCPNHADKLSNPKRRLPKQNASPLVVTKTGQYNNGNIDVTHAQAAFADQLAAAVDEILINGRRYKVPERIIMLDFWNKVGKARGTRTGDWDILSEVSSPLTSLSSSEDLEPGTPGHPPPHDLTDLVIAELLYNLKSSSDGRALLMGSTGRKEMVERGVQTETEPPQDERHFAKRERVNSKRRVRSTTRESSGFTLASPVASSSLRNLMDSSSNAHLESARVRCSREQNDNNMMSVTSPKEACHETQLAKAQGPHLPRSAPEVKPSSRYAKTRDIQWAINGQTNSDTSLFVPSPTPKSTHNSGKRTPRTLRERDMIKQEEIEPLHRGKRRKGKLGDKKQAKDDSGTVGEILMADKDESRARWKKGTKMRSTPSWQSQAAQSSTSAPSTCDSSDPPEPSQPAPNPPLKIRLPRLDSIGLPSPSRTRNMRTASIGVGSSEYP